MSAWHAWLLLNSLQHNSKSLTLSQLLRHGSLMSHLCHYLQNHALLVCNRCLFGAIQALGACLLLLVAAEPGDKWSLGLSLGVLRGAGARGVQ